MKLKSHGVNDPDLFSVKLLAFASSDLKGGYLDFSHLTELTNIYITEIYIKNKSSRIKNLKITKKKKVDGVSLNGYVAS